MSTEQQRLHRDSAGMDASSDSVTFADIQAAAAVLVGVAHKTPVHTSKTLDRLTGCQVYCKCENFQRMGAFKIRGAYNAISRLDKGVAGVVAGSSGSHAQAVALAAGMLGLQSVIVMPSDALAIKVRATRDYGGEVVFFDRKSQRREDVVDRIRRERGYPEIPAHNHPHIIAGQGTVALELHGQVPDLQNLVVPVSGGGLMAGCAVASRALAPGCAVFGVEPEGCDDFKQSLEAGEIRRVDGVPTIADGLRCARPGPYAFDLARKYVAGISLVSDDEILDAVEFLWTRMKLVVEPSGAAGIAALLHGRIPTARGAKTGVICSGGNADIPAVAARLRQAAAVQCAEGSGCGHGGSQLQKPK